MKSTATCRRTIARNARYLFRYCCSLDDPRGDVPVFPVDGDEVRRHADHAAGADGRFRRRVRRLPARAQWALARRNVLSIRNFVRYGKG